MGDERETRVRNMCSEQSVFVTVKNKKYCGGLVKVKKNNKIEYLKKLHRSIYEEATEVHKCTEELNIV